MSSQGSFNNYVDQMLPNFDHLPFFKWKILDITWQSVDFLMTPTPLFLSTQLLNAPRSHRIHFRKVPANMQQLHAVVVKISSLECPSVCLSFYLEGSLSWDKHYWTQQGWARYILQSLEIIFNSKMYLRIYVILSI